MDPAQIVVTAGGTVLIACTVWFFFGKTGKKDAQGAGQLYACPMHPWVTSGDPGGECEVCGMKLVKR